MLTQSDDHFTDHDHNFSSRKWFRRQNLATDNFQFLFPLLFCPLCTSLLCLQEQPRPFPPSRSDRWPLAGTLHTPTQGGHCQDTFQITEESYYMKLPLYQISMYLITLSSLFVLFVLCFCNTRQKSRVKLTPASLTKYKSNDWRIYSKFAFKR